MSQLVDSIFSLDGLIAAILTAAIWAWRRPRSMAARRFLISVGIFYALASIYAIPFALTRLLSAGYERFDRTDLPAGQTAIVVLGAGNQPVRGWDERLYPLNTQAAARVLEAWRVFSRLPAPWIISSGGVPAGGRTEASSINMRDALLHLGVPADRIILESNALDTHAEAVAIAPMLKTLHIDRVVLVTSDVHMRRSLGTFRAQGIDALPAIAPDPGSWESWLRWIRPTPEGLDFSGDVAHELLGIPYYWMRGWWRPL